MIITEQKNFEEILRALEGENKIFIVGCKQCATLCQTGGEEQVKQMKEKLEKEGKTVIGWVVIDVPCHLLETKKVLREKESEVNRADGILVLACGGGTQSVREASNKNTHPGCNTLFLGVVERFGQFSERCSLCAECILEKTKGLCPITLCTKGLLNGPCGGAKEGKCEVDPEKDCGWQLIYKHLQALGKVDLLKEFQPAKDYSKLRKPHSRILERKA